jgi:signal transduction histidine kinase/CheY-like chemotaxis protein/integral membrane sensor domain MASE1
MQSATANPLNKWVKQHLILSNITVALLYFLFAEIGLLSANLEHQISPIWPPTGLLLACVFLTRRSLLPGIALANFLFQLYLDCSWFATAAITLGTMAAAITSDWWLCVLNKSPAEPSSNRQRKASWIFLSSLTTAIITSVVGTGSLFQLNPTPPATEPSVILHTWFLGDFIGALVITQSLLALRTIKIDLKWTIRVLLISLLAALSYTTIFFNNNTPALLFLAFPILLLASHWFSPSASSFATLGFVIYASFIASNLSSISNGSLHEQILLLDLFILALAITSLTLSSFYQRDYFRYPALLFLLGWFCCGLLYHGLRTNATRYDEAQFADLISDAEQAVLDRLRFYTDALQAAAAYYASIEDMTRQQWHDYIAYAKVPERYQGIRGIGLIRPFTAESIIPYIEQMRRSEFKNFTIKSVAGVEHPPVDEMGYQHYIVTHNEPVDTNRNILGFDTASEKNRQIAARRARDSGQATMTKRITLSLDGQQRPGFLIYVPIYKNTNPLMTIEERREAFIAWSYAPFVTEQFLDGVLRERADQISFEIYDDIDIRHESFVYGTKNSEYSSKHQGFDAISRLDLAGQTFSFAWRRGPNFQAQETSSATIAATSLAVGTCLLVGFIVNLQSTTRRANAIVKIKTAELLQTNESLTKEIRDREAAEKSAEAAKKTAEAANLAKSEFLATMSHEIRTPMNSVLGFSELLEGSKLSPEQHMWVSYIKSSGKSLLHIINDILDISKIEANKLELEQIPFSLDQAIREVTDGFSTLANQKGILIHYQKDDGVPANVIGDPTRLKQIISNLSSNALKFTSKGTITIGLNWTKQKDGGLATLSVSDTGIGIPPDKLNQLFKKFTQVDSSTTRKFGGTGLGLAICKRLADLMGGHIYAESHKGKGTTMTVEIPYQTSKSPITTITQPPFKNSPQGEIHNMPEILLVDDNTTNRQLGSIVLKRLGCQVTVAENGEKALEVLKTRSFPLMFLDCQMPVMDGFETTAEIRRLEASGEYATLSAEQPITIVAFTADASSQAKERCLKIGMNDYICKPVRKNDFKQILEKYRPS